MALNADDTLLNGHYRIIHQLGRGGFGFVYLAQDTLLSEQVAIKELTPALVGDETMLKRFLAEARATMRLRHDRIVGTHNVFREGDNYYIVMECMTGASLEERLRERGPLPVDEAVRVAAEVCEGLAYAHERGVVHCDLKPANILFDKDGHAKVADFGIAHVSGEMLTRTWHTPAGFVAGTLPYMSPEQAEGVRDDPRVDVYAIGAVLYRMLTGRPYLDFDQRETPAAQADNVYRIRNQAPQPPSVLVPRLPTWVDDIVLHALAKKPEERYASAEALRAMLLRQQTPADALPSTRLVREPQSPISTPALDLQTPSGPAVSVVPATKNRLSLFPSRFWSGVGAVAALLVFLIVVIFFLNREGNGGSATIAATATGSTPTQAAVATQTTTRAPAPTISPAETNSPMSTSTDIPQPTATLTNVPTATPRPTATRTSIPTYTPRPTSAPTSTPAPPTRTPNPEPPAAGATQTRAKDGMVMVYVPAGEFSMGSNDGSDNEDPVHPVILDAFWIDKTEITNAQYAVCVAAGACAVSDMGEFNPEDSPKYPIVQVTWHDASGYCRWAGGRLPTEAEWEKAARGTDGRVYPWGSNFDGSKVNYCDRSCGTRYKDTSTNDGYAGTAPVGSYPAGASPYGVLDMAGNVAEWVLDRYSIDLETYGSGYYSISPLHNPQGPDSGGSRGIRGGSFNSLPDSVRTAARSGNGPQMRMIAVGFRCAVSP